MSLFQDGMWSFGWVWMQIDKEKTKTNVMMGGMLDRYTHTHTYFKFSGNVGKILYIIGKKSSQMNKK